ncbi:sensor histidine kinase [Cryobacterium arcticum]|uniref:histidine kinase n=1 Tax=Cryobacterium arcticum TaxID=670052 RepID=A0A1B1BGW0_9MICO|nr:sensor histidine kinase [Cryobacterium arcticum]ANP71841.1 Putative two component system sensor kinase [Cryobacterium arcticum]
MSSSAEPTGYGSGWPERRRGWPGERLPPSARLWLPVVVSLLVQVPATAFQLWRGRWNLPAGGEPFGNRRWAESLPGPGEPGFTAAALLVFALAFVGPLALIMARRFPGPVAMICAVAAAAPILILPTVVTPFAAVAFAVVLGIVRGARIWVYASVALTWVATIALAGLWGISFNPFRIAGTTFVLVLLMAAGEALRRRRETILEHRRSADARRLSAEQRERMRIARELHDVLAHSLSLINVQAGVGLHLIDSQPQKAADALANIKSASKNALDEVRTVLGILRSDPAEAPSAPLTPEPDLAGLPALIESFRAQGLGIAYANVLEVESAAPAATQLALYRICQEALTNVLRHARSHDASVYLGIDRGAYLLTVTDSGVPEEPLPPVEPGGGLLGMRERAELLGGTLRAGPTAAGGFLVEARLPLPAGRAGQSDRGNG